MISRGRLGGLSRSTIRITAPQTGDYVIDHFPSVRNDLAVDPAETVRRALALMPKDDESRRELAARYGTDEIPITGSWGLTETAPFATTVHYPLRDPADIGLMCDIGRADLERDRKPDRGGNGSGIVWILRNLIGDDRDAVGEEDGGDLCGIEPRFSCF